jgi:hypothetical protein
MAIWFILLFYIITHNWMESIKIERQLYESTLDEGDGL